MKSIKNELLQVLVAVLALLGVIFFILKISEPVEIVDIHNESDGSNVLVRHFPYTDAGKLAWWKENEEMLKETYGVPEEDEAGNFRIVFWGFNDGYKVMPKSVPGLSFETTDLRCFDDRKVKDNCIEKDILFRVSSRGGNVTYYDTYNHSYMKKKDGEIIKLKDQE